MPADKSTVVERGPHHRVVEWTGTEADVNGQPVTFTNRYTEVASGLHYRGGTGEWLETVAEFAAVPGGFVAARGPHQVALSTDLSTPGAVTLVTPEGQILHSAPVLLAYVDYATGETVRLADLKAARGELVAPNVVLYADAFDTLAADVRATYAVSGFECDVVLRQQLPDPAMLGLNPETTEMAVYSEWPDARPDQAESQVPSGGTLLTDTALAFDSLVMAQGRAFGLDEQARVRGVEVPVRKTWQEIEGRNYLIERASYRALQPLLGELPGANAPTPEQRRRWRKLKATARLELPARRTGTPPWPQGANGRLLAHQPPLGAGPAVNLAANHPASSVTRRGVVLDYTIVNTTTNYTFDALTTYYISGPVTLRSNVTFQAGTVIKFAATNTPGLTIYDLSTLTWLGAPYRPVTLTSKDDTASGEPLPGASGTPSGSYARPALKLSNLGAVLLTNLCIRNADVGIVATGSSRPTVRHGQFVDCATGVKTDFTSTLQNVLFDHVTNAIWTAGIYPSTGEFVTVDTSSYVNYSPGGGVLSLTNSLLVSILYTNGCALDTYTFLPAGSELPVFKVAGAGAHYLDLHDPNTDKLAKFPPASSFMAAELASQTVYAPQVVSSAISADQTLASLVDREAGAEMIYIGYHYRPLDFYVTNSAITNATVTLTNGAVLGFAGTNGFVLAAGGRFVSQGRPEALNRLGWASAVQERATNGSAASYRRMFFLTNSPSTRPDLSLRLTRAEFAADTANRRLLVDDGGYFLGSLSLRDSQFMNAKVVLGPVGTPGPTLAFGVINNVFDTCSVNFSHYYDELLTVTLYHNLFLNGSLGLGYVTNTYNPVWTVKDNVFAGASLSGGGTYVQGGNNGYTAASAFWGGSGNQLSLVTTGTGGFTNGPLGGYYYPSSGGGTTLYALVNAGSRNATNAGLYHYTTQTSQAKETNSTVDIGFHYVATTGSGSTTPPDYDADLILDYLEDANGNGVRNGTESDWQSFDTDVDSVSDWDELRFGTDPNDGDSDNDGVSDYNEITQGTDPTDGTNSVPILLGDWRFNTAGSLTNQQGASPLAGGGVSLTPSYEGWAVAFGTNVAATNVLRYAVADGSHTNLNLRWGTIHLTYVPDWYFGSPTNAPGQICRLLECGAWQLNITADGQFLTFQTPAADGVTTNVNLKVSLPPYAVASTNRIAWEIQLEYSSVYSRININDSLYDGTGVHLPSGLVTTNGFCLGSAADGTSGARGYLDQLTTWNAMMEYRFASYHGGASRYTSTAALQDLRARRSQTLYATLPASGIDLHWLRGWEGDPAANAGNYNLERRVAGTTTWSVVATNLFTDIWHDTNVTAGTYYEYRLPRPGSLSVTNDWPTLVAARAGAPIESRGKVILLVDNSVASNLASDLNIFTNDLIGDGWTVARYDVPRHTNDYWGSDPLHLLNATNLYYKTNLLANRAIISNEWSMNPNGTNVVILLGHVTVPYSGSYAEDHHDPQHFGAWPADAWYADVDGQWSDTNSNSSLDPYLRNVAGDFKWDPNASSNLTFEVSVGRIDFDNLPAFGSYVSPPATNDHDLEVKLLQRYLAKNHAYRRGDYVFDPSLRLYDDEKYAIASGDFKGTHGDAAVVAARFFGGDLSQESYDNGFRSSAASRSPTLWAVHGGYGHIDRVQASFGNARSAEDIAPNNYVGDFAFGIFSGSWFGDWNLPYDDAGFQNNNLLRSCLAQTDNALAVLYGLNSGWKFPTQAVGDSLASILQAIFKSNGGQSVRTTFILGDPTLRFAQVKPPGAPTVTVNGGNVILTWTASGTAGAGYWVYSTTNLSSPNWTRLTSGAPITTLSYTNIGPTGTNLYLVRSIGLQSSGAGSYTNLSQGVFKVYP